MAESTFADDFKLLIADSGLPKVFGFIRENIGKASVVGYIYLTGAGVIRGMWFYHMTGINPFFYFGVEDYLILGARHPFGLLLPLLMLPYMIIAGTLASLASMLVLEAFRPLLRRIFEQSVYAQLVSGLRTMQQRFTRLFFVFAYGSALCFLLFYIVEMPDIGLSAPDKFGCSPSMVITLKAEAGSQRSENTIERRIVDSTEKFLFVKDPQTQVYGVVPLDSVTAIRPAAVSEAQGTAMSCLIYQ
jgi:hypothetical protein